jgi:hypothetical protein
MGMLPLIGSFFHVFFFANLFDVVVVFVKPFVLLKMDLKKKQLACFFIY